MSGSMRRLRPDTHVWSIVLAAGAARRFGGGKLLVRIRGSTLLDRAVGLAMDCTGSRTVVVLGADSGRLEPLLRNLPVKTVIASRWREGVSASLRAGLRALPGSARGALVLLADQYALQPADLKALCAAWRCAPNRPAAAVYQGQTGAPALFPRGWFRDLAALRGDRGARALLRHASRAVTEVEMPRAALDLDEPAQLADLRAGDHTAG